MEASETDPLLRQQSSSTNERTSHPGSRSTIEEMWSPTQGPEESYDLASEASQHTYIAFSAKQDEHTDGGSRICSKLKFICDSHWPLSCFLAVAFLGFWLPKKRKSMWPLTFIPVFHLLFGLGAHFYFMFSSQHRGLHIGSKMLLSALWVSAFSSYVLALYYFRYQSQEWMGELSRRQYRAINVALFTGVLLVSWVLFGDVYYQVIFDLVNIKQTLLQNCHHPLACNAVFYPLAVSIYWGMYSSIAVCCVFFSLCLVMTNDLNKAYRRIAKCTGEVRNALLIHREAREQIADRVNSIRVWFLIHMIFYVVVLLANIFEWFEAARQLHFAYEYMAQICGTLVVVYKFFFPFLSASYVTWRESTLVQDLNDKVDFLPEQTFYSRHDLELFFQQSRRRGYGFRLFKIQITVTIAIFSLLGSGFGVVHNFKG